MELEKIMELLKTDAPKAIQLLKSNTKEGVLDFKNEYKGDRKIRATQVGRRLDKTVGNKTVSVAKIPVNYQKKIVRSAAAFLFGSPVQLISENKEAMEIIEGVWNKNRMDSILQEFCEMVKTETEACLFFFPEDGVNNEGKPVKELKVRLYGSANGTYSPYFDAYGDLKAFTWSFTSLNEDSKKVENAWVFTSEQTLKYQKTEKGWELIDQQPQLMGKIPVVYMSQDEPEWYIVKELIDQNEMTLSKFIDTNSYFAAPIAKVYGEVKSMPGKEQQGKAVKIGMELNDGKSVKKGDIEYLTWEHAPEAIKLENEITKEHIHALTDTPDLSFDNVKGLGVTSGVALKLMFMGAMTKARWSHGDYSIAIKRIVNIIIAGVSKITDLKSASQFKEFNMEVKFSSILPDNMSETISLLSEATGGEAVMSVETAVKNNPLIENASTELEQMKKETTQNLGDSAII